MEYNLGKLIVPFFIRRSGELTTLFVWCFLSEHELTKKYKLEWLGIQLGILGVGLISQQQRQKSINVIILAVNERGESL